jgi:hypothetical protein
MSYKPDTVTTALVCFKFNGACVMFVVVQWTMGNSPLFYLFMDGKWNLSPILGRGKLDSNTAKSVDVLGNSDCGCLGNLDCQRFSHGFLVALFFNLVNSNIIEYFTSICVPLEAA